ncbi:MAG TPA: STAS domain-containing protein [Acidobacteriota bacterium]|nr:STAS domain-containing protein [Acidobacteriota bacterium]
MAAAWVVATDTPPMEYEKTEISGIPVFSPRGDLLGDRENQNLHEEVLNTIQNEPAAVILNLADVRFMVSAALGLMIGEYLQATENGVKLMLTNLQDRVRELLYITRLDAYLKDYGTVEKAVAAATATDSVDNSTLE